jgi:hypothetical protein
MCLGGKSEGLGVVSFGIALGMYWNSLGHDHNISVVSFFCFSSNRKMDHIYSYCKYSFTFICNNSYSFRTFRLDIPLELYLQYLIQQQCLPLSR